MRIGICPVRFSNWPSWSTDVVNFMKSQAVARLVQEAYMATFFASEKVWIWSAVMPLAVGTGTTPQSTLPL